MHKASNIVKFPAGTINRILAALRSEDDLVCNEAHPVWDRHRRAQRCGFEAISAPG